MSCQLPSDCLNEIFEYLEQDKVSLHSCLLVNRFWCENSVTILWRDIWGFYDTVTPQYQLDVSLQIISTLVACLPNESKDLLRKNGILITTQRSLFNYASFCKILSIHEIDLMIQQFLGKQQIINSQSSKHNKYLVSQEILKMFMKQISSLRSLGYGYLGSITKDENVMFTYFPGAKNCLTYLTELTCSSKVQSEFFYRVSQICHNIQSLTIDFGSIISDGLANLISLQNNLKSVTLLLSYYYMIEYNYDYQNKMEVITSSFSSTLIKLKINQRNRLYVTFSFIATLKNLQELILSFNYIDSFNDFNSLQHVTFPQLKVLKFLCKIPKVEALIKFIEINGKNLKEFYVSNSCNSLYLAVAKFCPNLQTLYAVLLNNDIDTLKVILNSCQYLESVRLWCGWIYLNEEKILEVIANHSPKNFNELKLVYSYTPSGLPKNLETFLISWKNRIPQISLSLMTVNERKVNDEDMKLIEKYKKLGIIKKFQIGKYNFRVF